MKNTTSRLRNKTICVALAVALAGCATVSPVLTPNVAAPGAWNEAAPENALAVSANWWSVFGSAELQELVKAALSDSPDLAIAIERVKQAEAQVRIAGASLFPTLNLGLGTSTRSSRSDGSSETTN